MPPTFYIEPGAYNAETYSICSYAAGHRSTIASGYASALEALPTARMLAGRRGRVEIDDRQPSTLLKVASHV